MATTAKLQPARQSNMVKQLPSDSVLTKQGQLQYIPVHCPVHRMLGQASDDTKGTTRHKPKARPCGWQWAAAARRCGFRAIAVCVFCFVSLYGGCACVCFAKQNISIAIRAVCFVSQAKHTPPPPRGAVFVLFLWTQNNATPSAAFVSFVR